MSFLKNGINLPQTPVRANKMQICSKCLKEKPPEGGVEMSATKWVCASCWTNRAIRRTYK
jgi:hypothetical protein